MEVAAVPSDSGFYGDDAGAVDGLLAQLARAYENITGEKRRYRMLQEREMRRKQRQCRAYEKEKRQLAQELDLVSKGVLVRRDHVVFQRILERLQTIQTIRAQIDDARQNVRRNEERLRSISDQVAHTRRAMGGSDPLFVWRHSAQRKVERVKIRIKKTVQIADLQSCERSKLRGRLKEEMALRRLYKGQIVRSLDHVESNAVKVNALVDESTQAFEDLNRIQHRHQHLTDRQRIDTQRLYQRIKDVERQLNTDSKLREFLDAKNRRRLLPSDSGGQDASNSKLGQAFRARDINPESLDLLVAHLKRLTAESNSSNIIRKFQDREANVWSTLTYVSVASKEADRLANSVDQLLDEEKDLVRILVGAEELSAATSDSSRKTLAQRKATLADRQLRCDERRVAVERFQQMLKDLCETFVHERPPPSQLLPSPHAAKSIVRRVHEDSNTRECVEEAITGANFDEFMTCCEGELLGLRDRFDCLVNAAGQKRVHLTDDEGKDIRRVSHRHGASFERVQQETEAHKSLHLMQPPRLDKDLGLALLKAFNIDEEQFDEDDRFSGEARHMGGGHSSNSNNDQQTPQYDEQSTVTAAGHEAYNAEGGASNNTTPELNTVDVMQPSTNTNNNNNEPAQ